MTQEVLIYLCLSVVLLITLIKFSIPWKLREFSYNLKRKGRSHSEFIGSQMIFYKKIDENYSIYQSPNERLLDFIGDKIMNNCIGSWSYRTEELFFIIDKHGDWKACFYTYERYIREIKGKMNGPLPKHLQKAWDQWFQKQGFFRLIPRPDKRQTNALSREARVKRILRLAKEQEISNHPNNPFGSKGKGPLIELIES